MRTGRLCASAFQTRSAVHFSEYGIEGTENRHDIGYHRTREHLGEDADVAERGRPDFHAVWDAATFAVDVKTKFALRVFRPEIDFSGRSVYALGGDDEVVDEFLHLR